MQRGTARVQGGTVEEVKGRGREAGQKMAMLKARRIPWSSKCGKGHGHDNRVAEIGPRSRQVPSGLPDTAAAQRTPFKLLPAAIVMD